MLQKIKSWYNGNLKIWSNDLVGGVYWDYHWTAKFAKLIFSFWLGHWKWIIGTMLAVLALIIK